MIQRIKGILRKALFGAEQGQAATEYAILSVMILGGAGLSWPFLIELLSAMNTYYNSIFSAIQCPLP